MIDLKELKALAEKPDDTWKLLEVIRVQGQALKGISGLKSYKYGTNDAWVNTNASVVADAALAKVKKILEKK